MPDGVSVTDCSDRYAMMALQGPRALGLVALPDLTPFGFTEAEVCDVECIVARTGYTGEPGVELMCGPDDAGRLWDALLVAGAVPCGLGARDTLRLEVCYPLYGNDLSRERTALEAGLGWVCALDAKDFTGAAALARAEGRGRLRPAGRVPHGRARHSPPGHGHRTGRARSPAAPCRLR